MRLQPFGAAWVDDGVGVLAAVEFHDQAGGEAGEVGDEGADRVLAAELVSFEAAIAQQAPEGASASVLLWRSARACGLGMRGSVASKG